MPLYALPFEETTTVPPVKRTILGFVWMLLVAAAVPAQAQLQFPLQAKRIVFLGDSITHGGAYVAWIDTQLRLQNADPRPEIINLGLSSETLSGLSEPVHPFPRPDLHERLDRVLKKSKPDVVVACYGINDGIYYPFDEKRFQAFKDGVNHLLEKVHAAGAKLVLLTPPPFDAVALRAKEGKLLPAGAAEYGYTAMYENYDDVMQKYTQWILQQKPRVDMVIDIRTPMAEYAAQQRKTDPAFALSPDGIHPTADGHRLMGEAVLKAWGVESTLEPGAELLKLVRQRMSLLHAAWLSDVGHQRPGIKEGLPLDEAQAKAAELDQQINALVREAQKPRTSKRLSTAGTIYSVYYPSQAKPDALRLSVTYSLWIPEGVKRLRGIIVHQHGCGRGASLGGTTAADDLHWQALAKKWECGLLGPAFEPKEGVNCRLWCDPRNGSGDKFLQALDQLAQVSGHPEVATVPWCLWGHSGGGFWASLMLAKHPERIVAIWLRSGTAFPYWENGEIEAPTLTDAVYSVPIAGNPGKKEQGHERFRRAWDGLETMQAAFQKRGAFFEFVPDPRTGHECGDSRYMAIPFFDFWLKHRLPQQSEAVSGPPQLRPVQPALSEWQASIAPLAEEYRREGSIADTTPPPAPTKVTAARQNDGSIRIDWEAEADFESGIGGFVILRGDEEIARLPEKPIGRFGRPLFQTMSYHDTPELQLPEMTLVDRSAPPNAVPVYRVRTINSMGLLSPPTASSN